MYKYIKNPNDNKKINIHSELGKNIIKKYLNFIVGGENPEKMEYIFNQRSENITEIHGLVGLDYYKFDASVYGTTKRILLLADEHDPLVEKILPDSNNAILFDELIIYLIQTLALASECVDFYLEIALTNEQGKPLDGIPFNGGAMYKSSYHIPMNNKITTICVLRNIFRNCSQSIVNDSCTINELIGHLEQPIPSDIKLDNLRLHNIDLRQNSGNYYDLMGSDLTDTTYSHDFYDRFLQYVLDRPGHPTRQQLEDMCLIDANCDSSIISAHIDKIDLVKRKINHEQEKFFYNKIFNIGARVYIKLIRKYVYEFYTGKSIHMPDVSWDSSSLNASLVDIYTIFRILKNFEMNTEPKRGRGPSKCKGISNQNNIIVFAGAHHTECFRYVLDRLPGCSSMYGQDSHRRTPNGNRSKILEIDTSQGFDNFNQLMTDFCEDFSNHRIDFKNLDNTSLRRAIQRYKYSIQTCPLIETWNVSEVTDMSNLFDDFSNFDGNITYWDTGKVTDMSHMFNEAISFNKPLVWDTKNVTNMSNMFRGATNFNESLYFDTEKVTNMSGMFNRAKSFNQPLKEWNTVNVTDMSHMFHRAQSFNESLEFTSTEYVTNMSSMFREARSFNQYLDFNTSNVTDMNSMFYNAIRFDQPLNFFYTGNVTNMGSMFREARSFNGNLTYWNTELVTDMSSMFEFASNFNQPLNFDTENVSNMESMFSYARSFNQLLNWNTAIVINMESMFEDAENFNQPLNWNTDRVINMNSMFRNAVNFRQTLDFNIGNDTDTDRMFENSPGRLNI